MPRMRSRLQTSSRGHRFCRYPGCGRTNARSDRLGAPDLARTGAGVQRARSRTGQGTGGGGSVSFAIAILGLLLLIFIHELGHFSAAKALGMRALRFTSAFRRRSPRQLGRHRVRHRRDPAGRLREDSGDAASRGRPVCVDDMLGQAEALDQAAALRLAAELTTCSAPRPRPLRRRPRALAGAWPPSRSPPRAHAGASGGERSATWSGSRRRSIRAPTGAARARAG